MTDGTLWPIGNSEPKNMKIPDKLPPKIDAEKEMGFVSFRGSERTSPQGPGEHNINKIEQIQRTKTKKERKQAEGMHAEREYMQKECMQRAKRDAPKHAWAPSGPERI